MRWDRGDTCDPQEVLEESTIKSRFPSEINAHGFIYSKHNPGLEPKDCIHRSYFHYHVKEFSFCNFLPILSHWSLVLCRCFLAVIDID